MLTHTNPKENKCNICSKGFTFKRNLKRHMEIHEQVGIVGLKKLALFLSNLDPLLFDI